MALLLLSSCQQIPIRDSEWFGSKGPKGAVAFHTLTKPKKTYTWDEFIVLWNNLKHKEGPLICTHSDTFAQIKVLWETCVTNGACSFVTEEQKGQAQSFFSNINSVKTGGN